MLKTRARYISLAVLGSAVYLQASLGPVTGIPPSTPQVEKATARATLSVSSPRKLLDQDRVTCHNEKLKTAGLLLDHVDVEKVGESAEIWEKVVRRLRSGAMPPTGLPRPTPAQYQGMASWLEAELDRVANAAPNPGRPGIHRLNRVEYVNSIRELLALEIDGRSLLPGDDLSYGFDNMADALSVSQGLMERYLSAARTISRLAVGDPTIRPGIDTYRVSQHLRQNERVSEDLPFGSEGGVVIRQHFPLDGEYIVRIRLQKGYTRERINGIDTPNQLDVRLDGSRIKLFTVGGKYEGGRGRDGGSDPDLRAEYNRTADEALEVRFPAKAGTRLVGVSFVDRSLAPEGVRPGSLPVATLATSDTQNPLMAVDTVTIAGPYGAVGPNLTPSRVRIFVCHPSDQVSEEACAKTILSGLARRAYRRPVGQGDLQTLLSFFRDGRSGRDFDTGIEWALERMLIAPDFLFRIERNPTNMPPGAAHRVTDLELASRLSFFLWSSVPDEELLTLASRGKLRDQAVLEHQVRRMLGDERSRALIGNFFGQWLYLRNLGAAAPDTRLFPDFDENLREAFEQETELFLESQLREDRSVTELLTARYTFVNERLARHYQIPNIYGSHFRRVMLPDDRRGGLLGQGSILTVTSHPTRTSPVLRGKWVLENLLGAPPPPPPPNVPELKSDGDTGQPLSVRAQMERHRKNPVCASCHARMDPLGFALENFDAIGRWRTMDGDIPIDASGAFPDGSKFDGSSTFRSALLLHRDEYVMTVTEKLLTYALGRGVEYFDMPSIRTILRKAAPGDYRWSSLILAIVNSAPFQMRRADS